MKHRVRRGRARSDRRGMHSLDRGLPLPGFWRAECQTEGCNWFAESCEPWPARRAWVKIAADAHELDPTSRMIDVIV